MEASGTNRIWGPQCFRLLIAIERAARSVTEDLLMTGIISLWVAGLNVK